MALTADEKDIGKALVGLDYAYIKTNGEVLFQQPIPSDLFATTLVMVDRDTGQVRATSMPSKATTPYQTANALDFIKRLNLERVELRHDPEHSIAKLAKDIKEGRVPKTDITPARLHDSKNMGFVEAPIRWWEATVRTLRYAFEAKYGLTLTADSLIWPWLTRHAAWMTCRYRVRADGLTSHHAAFDVGYKGEIATFGETALFKVPMTSSRQVGPGNRAYKGDSTMIKGIWVGKTDDADEHMCLTPRGRIHVQAMRRLEPAQRWDIEVMKLVKGFLI